MRRGLIAFVIAGLVLPLVIGVGPAAAQLQLNTYPSGIVNTVNTAVTIGNTTTATSIYSFSVPARVFQTLKQSLTGSAALHLTVLGSLTTNAASGGVGTVNLGCNYGGTTASIALSNALAPTANLTAMPIRLDLWVRAQGTGTASQWLQGRMEYATVAATAATAPVVTNAAVLGTTTITSAQTLTCTWLWASASTTNTVTFNSAVLAIGE